MLPRAALRAPRASLSPRLRHAAITSSPSALRIRTYASAKRSPPPPPPPSSARPKPPPPKAFKAASGPARQTSPGTGLPKDQTWKPEDGIKLERQPVSSPVEGARTTDAPSTQSPLENEAPATSTPKTFLAAGQVERLQALRASGKSWDDVAAELHQALTPEQLKTMEKLDAMRREGRSLKDIADAFQKEQQEPLAQKLNLDEPVPNTTREHTQDQSAKAENQAAPEAPIQLPDLRQGIPSTFNLEFGQGKPRAEEELSQEEKLDVTSPAPESGRRGDGEEKEYDRSAYETSLDRRRARLMNYMYAAMVFGIVTTGFYLSRPYSVSDDLPAALEPDNAEGWSPNKMWARVRARFGSQTGYYTEPAFPKLLPDVPESQRPPFTLVLSLEDLMIHTEWDTKHGYRTAKRPGIDYFIRYLSPYYELVLFTSAPRAIADPVVAKLDPYHFIMWPLGREATKYEKGQYVKDLSYLNRDLKKTLIVDTHAAHVKNQPENAIILPKWSGDPKDPHTKDLVALIPFLEYVATMGIDDVRTVLQSFEGQSIPEEFARREALAREKFQKQLAEEQKRRPKFSLGSIAGAMGVKGGGSMGGGMVLADGQSVAEGLAQGKTLSDQIREQGQRQYEQLEKQIREHGEQWLKEEAEENKKMMEAQMKDMKQGAMSWFGGGGKKE